LFLCACTTIACDYRWQWLSPDGGPPPEAGVDAGLDARVDAQAPDAGADAAVGHDPVFCVVGSDTCPPGETCYRHPNVTSGLGACSQPCTAATEAEDCVQPVTGTAIATCSNAGWCSFRCDSGEVCPDGMTCDEIDLGTMLIHRCQFH
jgi:hypothetical protein